MNVSILKSTVKHHRFQQASFIQSACGPYVIKIDYLADDGKTSSALLKDKHNQVMSFKGLSQCYQICRKAHIREARLEQWLPQLEACYDDTEAINQSHRTETHALPVRF
jgi:hypothetical protein